MASAWGLSWGKAWGNAWGRLDTSYLTFPEPTGGVDQYDAMLTARTRWIKAERRRLGLLPPEQRETFLQKVEKQSVTLTPAEWNLYGQLEQATRLLNQALELRADYEALLRFDLIQHQLLESQIIEERDIMFLLAVLSEL